MAGKAPEEPGAPGKDREFDPTAELWDRLTDDIIATGGPCLATVEKLVQEACELPPRPPRREDEDEDA
ncbi:MAG: hypothetical protein KQJ78_09645 [Deltaproteobacteria bacterium]|nr:hypothetical protein [Deltaproteobacteria bacterium]